MSRPAVGAQRYEWRIAVVEDHLLQRKRTEELLHAQSGLSVVWSGETFPQFTAWLDDAPESRRPHLLVLDLMVERGPSVDPARVRELTRSGVRVLVLSAMGSPELVRKILQAGIGGIVGKRDPEEDIVAAIWTVLGRGQWLTPELASVIAGDADRPRLSDQEERALVLYASGLTLDAVASALGVRKDTAKKYLSRVKAKYAAAGRPASTKLELNAIAQQDGYLDPPARV
ncbi:response regulator [Pimelobacter simplex]|uniref:response regulator n=1 Tax=Nocardioides simplex TaxID=2045 RepID=UPI0013759C0C|nr:response regulator [Pimelobacter simplex]